jgi:aldehyde:ferredoxin oxidoreductase
MQRVLLDLSSFQREGKIPITDLNGDRFEERGMLVAGNFESSIGPTVKIKNLLQKKGRPYGCTGCIMPCKQVFELPGVGLVSGTCAYQGLASSFWTEDPKSWGEVVILTQKLGIDQVTLMFLIAFIMEMYGKGIMNREDTDGIAMDRGNMGGVISMVHKIATREGCGNVFAEGTLKAARMLGRGMERYVMHNKGLELLPVALRNKKATSLAAAVSNRGDFQTEVWPLGDFMGITEEGKKWVRDFAVKQNLKKEHIDSFINPMSYDHAGDIVKHFQPLTVIVDLIGWCKWMSLHSGKPVYPEDQAKIVSAVTNMDIDGSGLIEAAERVYNLERAYNVRVGITRENDSLPERFFAEPAKARVGDGEMLDHGKFEKMKDEYYELRGWDVKTGIPTSKTLKGLGLKDVAKDLKKRE